MKENSLYIQALQEVFDAEFENDMNSLEPFGEHTFTQKHDKKMKNLISRQSKPYFKLISTAGRRAACVAAAIILFSASALSVKAVRETFFVSLSPDHDKLTIQNEPESGHPDVIENEYYISALPDSFELVQHEEDEYSIYKYYVNDDNDFLVFDQRIKIDLTIYNVNGLSFYVEQDKDGQKYLIVDSANTITFIWDNGEYIFEIQSSLDKETVRNLCRSIKIKK